MAREAESAIRLPYLKLERAPQQEVEEQKVTTVALSTVDVIAVVLFVACGLLTWQILT